MPESNLHIWREIRFLHYLNDYLKHTKTYTHTHLDILSYRLKNNLCLHREYITDCRKQASQIYVCQLIKVKKQRKKK